MRICAAANCAKRLNMLLLFSDSLSNDIIIYEKTMVDNHQFFIYTIAKSYDISLKI